MVDTTVRVDRVMTSSVISVNKMDKLNQVAILFQKHNFHHLPVLDANNQVIGIISKADYNKFLHHFTVFNPSKESKLNEKFLSKHFVMEVMTKHVVKLKPDDTVEVALGIFRENLFHALPVVDQDNKLKGILSTYDLISYAYN